MAEGKIEVDEIEKKMRQHGIASEDNPDGVDGNDVLALVAEVRRLRAIAHNDGVVKEAAHGVIEHTDAENARLTHVLGIQNAALLAYVQKYKPDALPGDDIAEVVTRDAEQLRAENAALKKALATYVMTGAFTFATPDETAPQDAPKAAWTPRERSHIRVTKTGEKATIFQVFFAPLLGRTLYRVEHTNGEYSDYERDEIERDE